MNLKKTVMQSLEKTLKEHGYCFNKQSSGAGVYCFYKKDKLGFDVGLCLDKSRFGNRLRPNIDTPNPGPTNLYYATEGEYKEFLYNDEGELEIYLQQILNQFITKGIQWLKDNEIEKFSVQEIFSSIADGFFKRYSFERVHTGAHIPAGGIVIYKKDNVEIDFGHSDAVSGFNCTVVDENNLASLFDIAKRHGVEHSILGHYKSKDDYIRLLEANLKVLEEYYFPQL